jgi:superfamily I DNA and/or RNA helicase
LYNLFQGETGTFPPVFDWIVFDEASQALVPQALLSLVHGKGHFLFLGDIKQLPPVVLGNYAGSKREEINSLLNLAWSGQLLSTPH